MDRSRKQAKKKKAEHRPSWVQAIKKKYVQQDEEEKQRRIADGEEEGAEVQDEIDEEKEKRLNEKQPLETQLFLKGVPASADDDDLKEFFSQFGKVRRVFQVKSHITKRTTGSAFVHFFDGTGVEKAFSHAQQNSREVAAAARADRQAELAGLTHHQAKRQVYKLKQNSHESSDPFVTINESRVVVHKVLSRTDSQEATSAMIKKRKRTRVAADDPRHLYLLQEGMITRDSPAAQGLPERYLRALEQDYEQRKESLKNINMFVSTVRVSIRNIPRKVTAAELRKLIIKEAKGYFRSHPEDLDKSKWGKHGPVKNLKILVDGNGVSRGFGFCELACHGAALHVLRRLNNNPTIYGQNQRLMISFAVENMNAVQKLQRIRELRRTRMIRTRGEDEEEEYE